MKKYILSILLVLFCSVNYGQEDVENKIQLLSSLSLNDQIIKEYTSDTDGYSAKSLFYIGSAYYMVQNDSLAIQYMGKSIAKDSTDPGAYYIKAASLKYLREFSKAAKNYESAINLKPDDIRFYQGLGESYYQLKNYDLALKAYKKATEQENCTGLPYSMIGQIYSDLKDNSKALEAFYHAKSKYSKDSKSYLNVLFNIGLYEKLIGNLSKAEIAYKELIEIAPTDYHSYAKLMQIYYHKKDYQSANIYRVKLYSAHKKGELSGTMKDMFCFDQFDLKGYRVQVFERYEDENKGEIYNKHLFYLVNEKSEILFRAQTEFSPISIELGGTKYILCASSADGTHYNSGIGFDDNYEYEKLKSAAIGMLEKYIDRDN